MSRKNYEPLRTETFLIISLILFIASILLYIQTRPQLIIDQTFLGNREFTPSKEFMDKLFMEKNRNHRLFYLTYYQPAMVSEALDEDKL